MILNLKKKHFIHFIGKSILKTNDSLGTESYFTFISLLSKGLMRWKKIR